MASISLAQASAAQRGQLGEALMALFHVYSGTLHAAATAVGLTVPQAMLIDRLPDHDPQPMTAIANMLGCDTSNATGLVDRLEQHQLVERRSSPTDRRVRTVVLTASGRQAKDELARLTRTDNPLFTDLDAPTCRQLTTQLLRMANHDIADDVVPVA